MSRGAALSLYALLAIIGTQLGAWRQRKAEAARLDQQLAAERERLELQLAAERERQSERLQSERALKDLDEMRRELAAIIDKAASHIRLAGLLLHQMVALDDHETAERRSTVAGAREDLYESVQELRQRLIALQLLIGPKHDLCTRLRLAINASERVRTATTHAAADRASHKFTDLAYRVLELAHEMVGTTSADAWSAIPSSKSG